MELPKWWNAAQIKEHLDCLRNIAGCKNTTRYRELSCSAMAKGMDLSGCRCSHCEYLHLFQSNQQSLKKNQHLKSNPDSEYAFSFTQPPDYPGDKSGRTLKECAEYLFTSGRTSKGEKIIKGAYVEELTKAGVPHIHGVYATGSGNQIQAKYFKRAWDLWDPSKKFPNSPGHQGGYHRIVRNSECYDNYMAKEGVVSRWLGLQVCCRCSGEFDYQLRSDYCNNCYDQYILELESGN